MFTIDEFQINEINVDLRTSGFDNEVLSVNACAVWWERESFYCLPRMVLWLDTESLGFNAEVRGLGQFEIRLYAVFDLESIAPIILANDHQNGDRLWICFVLTLK